MIHHDSGYANADGGRKQQVKTWTPPPTESRQDIEEDGVNKCDYMSLLRSMRFNFDPFQGIAHLHMRRLARVVAQIELHAEFHHWLSTGGSVPCSAVLS